MIRLFSAFPAVSPRAQRGLLLLSLLIGVVICMAPDGNPDLPMHIATGRSIVQHRAVPRTEFFSWTRAGTPWIDYEWGSQLLFYAVDRAGGAPALWLLKVAGFASLMLPLIFLLRLWRLPDLWIAPALFPYMLSFLPFLNVRAEIASFFLAAVQLCLLEAVRLGKFRGKTAPLLLAQFSIYALWANLHPAYPIGLLACATFAAGEAFDGKSSRRFVLLGAAGLLGSLVNPYGLEFYATFLRHGQEAAILRAHVLEWQMPTPWNVYQTAYWIFLLFCVCIAAIGRLLGRRMPAAHEATVAVVALASLTAYRQTAYLSLLAFPLALKLGYELRSYSKSIPFRFPLLALFFLGLANIAGFVLQKDGIFRGFRLAPDPKPACDFLLRHRRELSSLRLYNSWHWGGYLDYALYPDYRMFMDGRFGGVFTDFLPRIDQAVRDPRAWRAFLDGQGVQLVLLDRSHTGFLLFKKLPAPWRPLDVYYLPQDEWALLYWDRKAGIWVRRSAVDPTWLARHEYRWLHPEDALFLRVEGRQGKVPIPELQSELWRYFREMRDPSEGVVWVDALVRAERHQRARG